jgi:hypothetical protein
MKRSARAPGAAAAKPLAAIACCLCLIAGCASIPRDKSAADWLHVLPAGSSYYLCLNTGRSKELALSALKKTTFYSKDVEQLIGFTDQVYCGVRIGDGKPAFSLVMLGTYPTLLKSALAGSGEWEEIKGGETYWRHRKFGLQAAVPLDYMVIIAQDNIEGIIASARSGGAYDLSAEARDQIRQNDITLLFPLGLDEIVSGEIGLPLPKRIFEEIWIGARLRDNQYQFHGVFHVGPDVEPAAFKKLLQFFLLALLRRNGVEDAGRRLSEMKVEVEGRLVRISGFQFTKTEMETLISALLSKGL